MSGVTEQERCKTCGHLFPRKGKGAQRLKEHPPDTLVIALALWAFRETIKELPEMARLAAIEKQIGGP